jgi:hypothetical protein
MPLPPAAEREPIHTRRYEFQGYLRKDGLWDIEGRLVDTKTYGFDNDYRGRIEPGEPLHDFLIHDIEAVTESGPFPLCPAVAPNFKRVIGQAIAPGWNQMLRMELGGTKGCTHLVEMLGAMATVAYQTLYPARERKRKNQDTESRPKLLNTCHALDTDGEVVKRLWPKFYTGDDASAAPARPIKRRGAG